MNENNRLSINAVMAAMSHYAKVAVEEQDARAAYDGHSWDYHGEGFLAAVAEAESAAETALNEYINEVVRREVQKALAKAQP